MSAEDDAGFTLDDYIKKMKNDGSLSLLGLRKKKQNINEDEINASLDDIARMNAAKRGMKCGISKFDRFNDDSGNQTDDDDDDEEERSSGSDYRKSYDQINNDMEMMDLSEQNDVQAENSSIRFAKEIQKMDHPECCRIKKHFTTVESAMGIKIKSQQWRVENPRNPPNENLPNKVLNGRIQKNYKKNGIQGAKAGIFIEKGNFTYKFNDDPSNDSEDNAESIVGIVRNRPVTKIVRVGQNNNNNNGNYNNNFRNNRQNGNGSGPININMNWNGFFKGMSECMKTVAPTTQPLERKANGASGNQEIQLKIAASDLLEVLKAKRDKSSHKVSFSEPKQADPINEYIVSASAGNGIEMDFVPSVTNMPLNLRFA